MQFFFTFSPEVQNTIYGELDLKSLANLNCVSLGFNRILQPQLTEAKSLADALYNTQQAKTLAQWIDEAGYILICARESHVSKRIALSFLIYNFDLPQLLIKPNQRLFRILSERQTYKRYNAEYIPGFSPKHLHLPPEEQQITQPLTDRQKALIINQELLDVGEQEKKLDLIYKTPYLTCLNRANHRVIIYQGKFYQAKRLFDTRNYTSHNKTQFAAYTFNANGELSVFNHFGIKGEIVHSSMNSGCPVVCAGELQIRQGELKIINTHSGHYRPSLFNVYRFLNYLINHGVNIENSFVDLFSDVRKYQPKLKVVRTNILTKDGDPAAFYRISARMLVKLISEDIYTFLAEMTNQVKDLLTSFKLKFFSLKDKCINSQLTNERKALAQLLLVKLEGLMKKISEGAPIDEIEDFTDELKVIRQKNESLSSYYKKELTNGDLQALLCHFSNWMTIFNEKKDTSFFPIQGIAAMKLIY